MVRSRYIKPTLVFIVTILTIGYTGFVAIDNSGGTTEQVPLYADGSVIPQYRQSEPISFIEAITIGSSILVPTVIFVWWLLNIQQDKKNIEQTVKLDDDVDKKLDKVINNQHNWCIGHQEQLNKEFDKLHNKIDLLADNVASAHLESLRNFYDHSGKISALIKETRVLENVVDRLNNLERFMSTHYQYNVRTHHTIDEDVE